ncbi:uncharacterized protein BO97DRAFT_464029 [Aspergillus homomorphus CBS 101889]|uniref:Uncharacterized protein n=1 Tax=Aspergillus homomorphus (strain CBS 101889) TaxID=1450537 RepID=A0A395HJG8_ASPHC|nr:hypothetical protein BO97DRAFT_464029 [Aspergillus homomorphus CBS 101889]RAL07325.1 hypothetical protein BO97DRAFT_464029 [Aspergillus homomorphus CBS 101889]
MPPNDVGQLSRILRIPRSDEPNACVLLHIVCCGASILDLNLIGTEGECPYTGTVRQTRLNSYRSKNYQGTEDEWAHIMLHVLGQLEYSRMRQDILTGVETSASIAGSEAKGNEMTIVIRKRIQSITQKLGAIILNQKDEEAIHLYEWTSISAERTGLLEKRCLTLQDRCQNAEETINNLRKQLDEVINAKTRHEQQLVNNFMQLLNEKKLKIRNQQRVLASTDFASQTSRSPPGESTQITTAKGGAGSSVSKPSHTMSCSEDDIENLELERENRRVSLEAALGTDNEPSSTPQQALEEDGSTTDEDMSTTSTHDAQTSKLDSKSFHSQSTSKNQVIPPRRELPFAKTTGKNAGMRTVRPEYKESGHSSGETDDDEL